MGRGVVFGIIVLVFSFCFAHGVLAEFQHYNNTIKTNYFGGESLQGAIKIKFDKMPASTEITSNFGGNITLIELLKKQNFAEGKEYNCSTLNCLSDYVKSSSSNIFSLSLQENSAKIIGFVISGKDVEIDKIDMLITSNTDKSCIRDLLVDVTNNKSAFLQSRSYIKENCEPVKKGCFDDGLDESAYQLAELGNNDYCENITLAPAPAYNAGARIVNSSSGTGDIKIKMSDISGIEYGSCILPKHSEKVQTLSCIINHTGVFTKDYFVCISSSGGSYKTRFEQSGRICGTDQISENKFEKDYEIFAQTMKFDYPVINVGSELFSKINGGVFAEYVNDYISERYKSDCSFNGCFIPFSISGRAQELIFGNPKIKYRQGLTVVENDKLYLLEMRDAVVSSGVLTLELEKTGFTMPLQTNQDTLQIYIGGKALLDKPMAIKVVSGFSFEVVPRFALIGNPTTFIAFTSDNATITNSVWNFGDGNFGNSSGSSVSYLYGRAGEYNVEVSVQKADGKSAKKTFSVLVGDAKSSAKTLLERYNGLVSGLKNSMAGFPEWIKKEINKKFDLANLDASLTKLHNEFSVASTDESYANLVDKLLKLDVPLTVAYRETGNFPLSLGLEGIDLSYIEELTSKKADDKLKEKIINWIDENYNAMVKKEVVSLLRENKKEDLANVFSINLKPKKSFGGSAYLIIDYPLDAIVFRQDYGQKSVGSGSYIPLSGNKEENIEFVIPGSEIEVKQLGAYIGSEGAFSANENIISGNESFKFGKFLLWIFVLGAGLLGVYLVLQTWYKKYYENYLFQRKDDMYNLISFVKNSRTARLDEGTIRANLRKAGWSGEQITYAFNKLDGKRVLVWEIPIFKILENRRVQEEIAKRQAMPFMPGRAPSARFIKRL